MRPRWQFCMNAIALGCVCLGVLAWAGGEANGGRAAGPLRIGDAAPDFRLPGSDGKTYRLADFKGKKAVVLAWFPRAFTGG